MHIRVTAAILAIAVTAGPSAPAALGQQPESAAATTAAPGVIDVKALVRELAVAQGEARNKALDKVRSLPFSALPAVERAIEDTETSPFARADLQIAIPDIYARARAARKAAMQEQPSALRQDLLNSYQRAGKKDPRWDALVAAAFQKGGPSGEGFEELKAAVDAGCDDPLVQYFYHLRGYQSAKLQPVPAINGLRQAAQALEASGYPRVRAFYAWMRYTAFASAMPPSARITPNHVTEGLDRALALFSQAVKEDSTPSTLSEAESNLMTAAKNALNDRKRAFDKVHPVFVKALPGSTVPHHLAADFYTDWAWDARGRGWAHTVQDEGWKLMRERLALAEKEATAGWKLDPLDPRFPTQMITIALGSSGDRETMEMWYQRALLADPLSYEAAWAKMYFLYPRWHGSPAELLAFAQECLRNSPEGSRVPLLMVTAREELKSFAEQPDEYMASEEVWRDILAAYRKVLASDSDVNLANRQFDRAKLITHAYTCKKWQALLDLSKEFGDDIDVKAVGGKDLYQFYQRKAQAEVRKLGA